MFERSGRVHTGGVRSPHLRKFVAVLAMFLLAEGLILFRQGDLGVVVHAASTPVVLWMIQHTEEPAAFLFQSLLLVPVLRIFNLGMPIVTDNPLVFLGVIYGTLLVSSVLVVRSQGLSASDLGVTKRGVRSVVPGAVVGVLLGTVQYVFSLEGLVYHDSVGNYLLVILVTGLLVGVVEEVVFRGLIQRYAEALFGRWPAILTVSVLFGFMHSVWLTPLNIVFASFVSVFLGWVYAVNNDLWFITSVHAVINISAFLLAPLYLSEVLAVLRSAAP